MNLQELIEHPAPSAGRIIRGIYPYNAGGGVKIPERIMKNAQARGTWVHESIESEINTGQYESNWEHEGYMDAFHKFNAENDIEYLSSELCVVSPDERSKGIIDAVALIDGKLAILDFKTSASNDHARFELQLGIYASILDRLDLYDSVEVLHIVKLAKDGTYKLLYYQYNEPIIDSVIDVYHYMVEKGAIKTK